MFLFRTPLLTQIAALCIGVSLAGAVLAQAP
jgi:hypothetical protein